MQAALYEGAGARSLGSTPLGVLWELLQQPFPETRMAVYRLLAGLCSRAWVAAGLLSNDGMVQHLCDPGSESSKQVRVCVLMLMRSLRVCGAARLHAKRACRPRTGGPACRPEHGNLCCEYRRPHGFPCTTQLCEWRYTALTAVAATCRRGALAAAAAAPHLAEAMQAAAPRLDQAVRRGPFGGGGFAGQVVPEVATATR